MGELDYVDKLKWELNALGLSADERLVMIGKCLLRIKVFGDPQKDPSASLTFGYEEERKRCAYPLSPAAAALKIYEYLDKHKKLELARQPVDKPYPERTHGTFSNWVDRIKGGGKKRKKRDEVHGCLKHAKHADRYCADCWSVINIGLSPEEVEHRNQLRERAKQQPHREQPREQSHEQPREQPKQQVQEPPRRVFVMPPSGVMSQAKSIDELCVSDLAVTEWVVNAFGSPVRTADLQVSDLSPEMVAKLRVLSRRLRDLEAKIA